MALAGYSLAVMGGNGSGQGDQLTIGLEQMGLVVELITACLLLSVGGWLTGLVIFKDTYPGLTPGSTG